MPNLLLDLDIDRVDLVDEGANSEAHIRLYKRKEQEKDMTLEDLLAKVKPEHAAVITDAIEKAKKEATTESERILKEKQEELDNVKKDLEEANAKIEENDKKKEDEEDVAKSKDLDSVIKSLDPSVQEVFKSLQKEKLAAEEIAKAAAEKQLNDVAIAKAKELKALPIEQDKLVDVVKGISPEVYEVLKAANKAIEEAGVLDEVGVAKGKDTPSSSDEAWEALEKAARKIAEEEKTTVAKAMNRAVKENPELYKTYLQGGN